MEITSSDMIALIAIVTSVGSVFYAKMAADAAKISNRINLHQPRKEIFQAIFDFRQLFVEMDLHPDRDEIQTFYLTAVLPAHIYFSGPLVQKMYAMYKRSIDLFDGIVAAEENGSGDLKWELTSKLQNLGKTELDQLIREIANEIDLGNT